METRNCEHCQGKGEYQEKIYDTKAPLTPEGGIPVIGYRTRKCFYCDGVGTFPEPNKEVIWAALKGRKGMRTAKPKDNVYAAYVWRMARFHGGVDMTMPIMASLDVAKNPWRKELDKLSDLAAKEFFGSDLRAAARWGKAFGIL